MVPGVDKNQDSDLVPDSGSLWNLYLQRIGDVVRKTDAQSRGDGNL